MKPIDHMILSNAKELASPADVTATLGPYLLSRGREPEDRNFKPS